MAAGEFVSGAAFQIQFKRVGLFKGIEGRVEVDCPGRVPAGMRASSGIVLAKSAA